MFQSFDKPRKEEEEEERKIHKRGGGRWRYPNTKGSKSEGEKGEGVGDKMGCLGKGGGGGGGEMWR